MPCTLVRLVQFSKVFVTYSLSSDNYLSISQPLLLVNTFFETFLSFFIKSCITAIYYSPYGIRTRVTAVKRRCLNPLTNGPELFSTLSIIPTFSSLSTPFLTFFFIFYLLVISNSFITKRNSLKILCLPLNRSSLNKRSSSSCFSLLC